MSVNNGWVQIAEGAGSVGAVTVTGAGTTFNHDLVSAGHSTSVGQGGTGSLTISLNLRMGHRNELSTLNGLKSKLYDTKEENMPSFVYFQ